MNPIAPPTEFIEAPPRLSQPPEASPIARGPSRHAAEERLQELIGQLEALPDMAPRDLAQECLHSVLELYGSGLARVLQLAQNAGQNGQPLLDALVRDKLVR